MQDLLIQLFLVYPAVRWLMSPKRPWSHRTGVTLGILGLVILSLLQLQREPNHYDALNVSPGASKSEIESSYRQLSLRYHPDRQPDEKSKREALEKFSEIREAQETLRHAKKRAAYDRFGDYTSMREGIQFFDSFLHAVVHTLVSFFFGLIYTSGKNTAIPRQIYMNYLAFAFCLELHLRFSPGRTEEFLRWLPVFGNYLIFEKIKVVHKLAPPLLNGSLIMSGMLHSERHVTLEYFAMTLLKANLTIIEGIEDFLTRYRQRRAILMPDDASAKDEKLSATEGAEDKAQHLLKEALAASQHGSSGISIEDMLSWRDGQSVELQKFIQQKEARAKSCSFPVGMVIFILLTGAQLFSGSSKKSTDAT